MSTKHTDERLAKARPDEPIFVLVAGEPITQRLIYQWADWAKGVKRPAEEVAEARNTADRAMLWYEARAEETRLQAAEEAETEARREARANGSI